ncbi:bacterial bifunctional deaminase-reductase [Neocallimastix lanati (nom. inval.)]|jgi:2,5-diamino-6-(ribosylamino)-4(3H)-pyrimidinone 5'-phosphate reductase|uniref:2,5-diamino-6-ribosylamino-4(3H)-pyrimidinone 5'-phosphate reductase n=1 Tax=Neocallimastix californiae TaxID=1754190 RepID=A0A1Y2D968_9FUNG|nr:bacterial bifunctional deaminase-reductase [Neocallimastix sp. JGI-2020a]ORY55811.1 bacterial bifunctional deaminase-reductase [Neocallimastix californiae]|eukprot:ORY55811.1 bacterial bifunctional deaminase-reductase [Neocallimastix californiae]
MNQKEEDIKQLIENIYSNSNFDKSTSPYPEVTLTYAQTLDGFISGMPNTPPLLISGKESMLMTHCLRNKNEAIMVGIGTVLNDNPQLNVRQLKGFNDGGNVRNPQPIILDSKLRFPLDSKLLNNYREYKAKVEQKVSGYDKLTEIKPPIIFVSEGQYDENKVKTLREYGVEINVITGKNNDTQLDLIQVLSILKAKYHIQSVMVEGGAQVIRSFLLNASYVQHIIITLGPFFIGTGVKALGEYNDHSSSASSSLPRLKNTQSLTLGQDIVVIGKPILS